MVSSLQLDGNIAILTTLTTAAVQKQAYAGSSAFSR